MFEENKKSSYDKLMALLIINIHVLTYILCVTLTHI